MTLTIIAPTGWTGIAVSGTAFVVGNPVTINPGITKIHVCGTGSIVILKGLELKEVP